MCDIQHRYCMQIWKVLGSIVHTMCSRTFLPFSLFITHVYSIISLSLLIYLYVGPDSLPPVRVRVHFHGRFSYSGILSFILYISFISSSRRLLRRRLQYSGLNHFLTPLSTNMSINYTTWVVRPALREPSRVEWRVTNLFWVSMKTWLLLPNFVYYELIKRELKTKLIWVPLEVTHP